MVGNLDEIEVNVNRFVVREMLLTADMTTRNLFCIGKFNLNAGL